MDGRQTLTIEAGGQYTGNGSPEGVITSKIKHAIKHKTSPARLAQLLHNYCSNH